MDTLTPLRRCTWLVTAALLTTALPAAAERGTAALWASLDAAYAVLARQLAEAPATPWQPPTTRDCALDASAGWLEAQVHRHNARAERSDPGLRLEAGVSQAIDAGFEDDRARAYVGAAWNLLEEGRREHRQRAEVLDARAELAALRAAEDDRALDNGCRLRRLDQHFTPLQLDLLEREHRLLAEARPLLRAAYFDDVVRLDTLLDLDRGLASNRAARQRLAGAAEAAQAVSASTAPLPPLYSIREQALRAQLAADPLPAQLAAARDAVLAGEQRLRELDDQRLRLFARYEVDDIGRDAGGFVAGVTLQWPLLRRTGAPLRLRREQVLLATRQGRVEREHALADALRAFHDQRADTIDAHYRALGHLERLRQSLAQRSLDAGGADLARALAHGRQALRAAKDLVEELFRHHRSLLRTFAAADLKPAAHLVTTTPLPHLAARARSGDRDLYLWSHTLRRYPPGLLLEFAAAKGVQRLLVSAGPGADPRALDEVSSLAASRGLQVVPLVGANAWALPRNRDAALRRLGDLVSLHGAIHLDVEPQAMDDQPGTDPVLLQGYLDFLAAAREAQPNARIEVSAPLGWPAAAYVQVDRLVDRVHLMAYGTTDAHRLARRLHPVMDALWGSARVAVVVRASDFRDEQQLERLLDALASEFPNVDFAVHAAAAYIDLTTRS